MGMGRKLDEEKIKEIRKVLKKKTLQPITTKEVAKILNISEPTVRKYKSEENERKVIERSKKYKERTKDKRREYMRKYMMDRYRKDPVFRRRMLDNTLKYIKNNRKKMNKYQRKMYWRKKNEEENKCI